MVSARDDVEVAATSTASIDALTFGIAVSITTAEGNNGINLAGAGAGSYNGILGRKVQARIEGGSSRRRRPRRCSSPLPMPRRSTPTVRASAWRSVWRQDRRRRRDRHRRRAQRDRRGEGNDRGLIEAIVDGSSITAATGVTVKATSTPTIEGWRSAARSMPRSETAPASTSSRRRRRPQHDQGDRHRGDPVTAARRRSRRRPARSRCWHRRRRRSRPTPAASALSLKFGQGSGLNVSFGVGVAINESSATPSRRSSTARRSRATPSRSAQAPTTSLIDALAMGGALGIHVGTGKRAASISRSASPSP